MCTQGSTLMFENGKLLSVGRWGAGGGQRLEKVVEAFFQYCVHEFTSTFPNPHCLHYNLASEA